MATFRKDKQPPQIHFRIYCPPMGRWTKALVDQQIIYCYACGKILTLSHKENGDNDDIPIGPKAA